MSQIKVKEFKCFDNYGSAMGDAEKELLSIAGEIHSVRGSLRSSMLMKSYGSICRALDHTRQSVENCEVKVSSLEKGIESIRDSYRSAELQINDLIQGEKLETVEAESASEGSIGEASGGGSMGGRDEDTDASDLVSWWSKLISLIGKMSDNELIGFFSGGLNVISGWLKLMGGDYDSYLDAMKDIVGSLKGIAGFASGTLKLLGSKGGASKAGLVSAILGSVKGLIGAAQGGLDEFLIHSDQLIGSAGPLGTAIYSLLHPEYFNAVEAFCGKSGVYAEKVADVAAVTSLFTMITRGAGDVIAFSKDGNFTWGEAGQTMMDTGIVGVDSLVSGLTFGLIDIDSDSALQTFNSNIDAMSQLISDTGLPVEAQVALGLIASPAVAAASVAEVAVDTIENTAENIAGFCKWVGSWFH